MSRSWSSRDGMVLAGIAIVFNYLSLLYLRFAYHKVYEGERVWLINEWVWLMINRCGQLIGVV